MAEQGASCLRFAPSGFFFFPFYFILSKKGRLCMNTSHRTWITRNLDDFQNSKIKAVTPQKFLEIIGTFGSDGKEQGDSSYDSAI